MAKLIFKLDTLTAQQKTLYDAMVAKRKSEGAPFGGPYATLMNHPELCQKIEDLGFYLKFKGHLPRNIYQFIVLSVAQYTQCDFEWNDHIEHARKANVPESMINLLKENGLTEISFDAFPSPYQLVAKILNYTLKWQDIPENIQNEAIQMYGKQGLIEIVVLSGFYQMFSAINQGFDI